MLHPFTPYVTEELWGHLRRAAVNKGDAFSAEGGWGQALINAQWPLSKDEEAWEKDAIKVFASGTIEHTRAFRSLKTDADIPAKQKCGGAIIARGAAADLIDKQKGWISSLAAISDLEIHPEIPDADEYQKYSSASIPQTGTMVFLKTSDVINPDEMRASLKSELQNTNEQISRLKSLLASDFSNKAPAAVVEKEKLKLINFTEAAEKIQTQLDGLN